MSSCKTSETEGRCVDRITANFLLRTLHSSYAREKLGEKDTGPLYFWKLHMNLQFLKKKMKVVVHTAPKAYYLNLISGITIVISRWGT